MTGWCLKGVEEAKEGGESSMWNCDLGTGSRRTSPRGSCIQLRLLGMKTAVEPVFLTLHFPLKQSCIPSKLLNIYLNILFAIFQGLFRVPCCARALLSSLHMFQQACPWSQTAV